MEAAAKKFFSSSQFAVAGESTDIGSDCDLTFLL